MSFPESCSLENLCDQESIARLRQLLDLDSVQFADSPVYDVQKRENAVVPTVRTSSRAKFSEAALFDWVDRSIVGPLNSFATDARFFLVRDDLEVVRYRPGDFFKAHRDHVNVLSNMFECYTFLLCLSPCREGGETILYDQQNVPTIYECTARAPGSVLVFPKTTLHEGASVSKGEKLVLMGNLIAFPSTKSEDHVLVRGMPFPAASLPEGSAYLAFYEFSKRNNPSQSVFVYKEEVLSDAEVAGLFERYMSASDIKSREKRLESVGMSDSRISKRLRDFLRGSDPLLMCDVHDYYAHLDSLPDGIVPVHAITIRSEKTEIIIWSGLGDNRFLCCDYKTYDLANIDYHQHPNRTYGRNGNPASFSTENESELAGESDSDREGLSDPECQSENGHAAADFSRAYRNLSRPFRYRVADVLGDSSEDNPWLHRSDPGMFCWEQVCATRRATWRRAGLEPLGKLVQGATVGRGAAGIFQLISLVTDRFGQETKSDLSLLEEGVSCSGKPAPAESTTCRPTWAKLDPLQLIESLLAEKVVSKKVTVGEAYYCNESSYAQYEIVGRFAYLRL